MHAYVSQPIVCRYQPLGPNFEKESQGFVTQVVLVVANVPRSRFVFAVMEKNRVILSAAKLLEKSGVTYEVRIRQDLL